MPQHSPAERSRRWFGRAPDALRPSQRRVLDSTVRRELLAADHAAPEPTLGERISDRIAAVGGSWGFICGFLGFLALWVLSNAVILGSDRAVDPYPFIFLNLILSMLAALQAPIIMMSQNRAAEHDRRNARFDYEVNLKAEIEIIELHEKIDALRTADLARATETLDAIASRLKRIEAHLTAPQSGATA